jgi:hypothetical protein
MYLPLKDELFVCVCVPPMYLRVAFLFENKTMINIENKKKNCATRVMSLIYIHESCR